MTTTRPHIAILGAGPTGLEAALAAAERGLSFTLYEAAPQVAGAISAWGHVRLFTPWALNASPRMRQHLATAGQAAPSGDHCPQGHELVSNLLEPLAALPTVRPHLRLGERVLRVGRQGLLKHEEISSSERASRPFRLLVQAADGSERVDPADVVLDCTGSSEPNALGDGGIPAPGEAQLGDRVHHQIPDLTRSAADWIGKTVLLVGAGHSAQTALCDLAPWLANGTSTRVIWAQRHPSPPLASDPAEDPLPERGRLIARAQQLQTAPPAGLTVRYGVVVETLHLQPDGTIRVNLRQLDGSFNPVVVDRILALTGQVGDHLLYRQLQVHECYATSGPMKLAAALLGQSGASGDCLAQASMGAATLVNPEPGFFILGRKSYGRRTDYLLRVGWQQVDEVFSLL